MSDKIPSGVSSTLAPVCLYLSRTKLPASMEKPMRRDQPRWENRFLTRRELLCRGSMGMGAIALAGVMRDALGDTTRAAAASTPRWRRSNHTSPPRPNA